MKRMKVNGTGRGIIMLDSLNNANQLILVVDDDPMNLRMAEFILERQGYIVCKVESGVECLSYLKIHRPDLILLDIEMPIMNGIRTLEIIRSTPEWKDIPVMFLTAAADPGTVVEAGSLGIVDYVKKPFMPEELIKRVKNVFEA